jgi:dihydrofolate synthase/folylpolyglutamate synthase
MTPLTPAAGEPDRQPVLLTEPSDVILARLETLHPEVIDLCLDRVERLLAALGNPQDSLKGVVHVAGTNGKGSMIAYMKAILEAACKRLHVFTSPHLVRFHERIALAGPYGAQQISEADLCDYLLRVEAANQGQPITYFEITTAAAFLAFAENPADYVLLETGLGGRLDATNVVKRPALTVVMPVSLDHERHLGPTLDRIAAEKAGILKRGVPCILARQEPAALEVIEARAAELDVPLIAAGQAWDAYEQHGRLIFQTDSSLLDLPLPGLVGRHQIDNAGAALAAIHALEGGKIGHDMMSEGLRTAKWPARLQNLTDSPLNAHVAEGSEIWLDGGHNESAGKVLARAMAEMEERASQPLHLICGMMKGKDAGAFFSHFSTLAEYVATVPVPGKENAFDANVLARMAADAGLDAHAESDVVNALAASRARANAPVRVLVCGSLYLAGHVLKVLEKKSPGQ